jgi:hypothetical protein
VGILPSSERWVVYRLVQYGHKQPPKTLCRRDTAAYRIFFLVWFTLLIGFPVSSVEAP